MGEIQVTRDNDSLALPVAYWELGGGAVSGVGGAMDPPKFPKSFSFTRSAGEYNMLISSMNLLSNRFKVASVGLNSQPRSRGKQVGDAVDYDISTEIL
ncbi:hypothetical protein C5167_010102 [Papaver somniferum]|uniref:Uncharacterized protein n=1 Tax=Papaver somniferum TaxID=3469 RepID=A0A4Y7K2B5_PAPSO|nr:hypothetical protein C5167_010102 [Papaver somniferum]